MSALRNKRNLSTARMRRKLKKFKTLVDNGKMSHAAVRAAYQSWRGNYKKRFNAYYHAGHMDMLYTRLFFSHNQTKGGM